MLIMATKLFRRLHTRGILWRFAYYAKKSVSITATCWTSGLRGTPFTPSQSPTKRRSTNLFESSVPNMRFLTHSFVAWLHWNSKSKEHNRQSCELPHVSTRVAAKELVATMDAIVFLG